MLHCRSLAIELGTKTSIASSVVARTSVVFLARRAARCHNAQLQVNLGAASRATAGSNDAPIEQGRRHTRIRSDSRKHQQNAANGTSQNVQALIDALQGDWGDDTGLTIHVSGNKAQFSDGSGSWSFEQVDDALVLRGSRLTGTAAAPAWQCPTGVERHWARTKPATIGGASWTNLFLSYKETRLEIRRQLREAFAVQDFDRVSILKSEWANNSLPAGLSEQQKAILSAGQWLVPGVCFRHKKLDYRGVVLGYDSSCSYPAAWRAKWVPNRPAGEAQPFYHCLVDERDRPGRQSRYVAEANMLQCDMIFPIQARLAEMLLVRCDEQGVYLPSPMLEVALHRQRVKGDRFMLTLGL